MTPPIDVVDDETEYDYQPTPDPALTQPQVSSVIAIIRIISVLAMGLFVSFGLDIAVNDHPPNRSDVALRIMPADGSAPPVVLTRLFGGQGTINVPSWSPDGKSVAFVSYRLVR